MFLDREPYIRYWRPTYRLLGPSIRSIKAALARLRGTLLGAQSEPPRRIEARLANMEHAQQELHSALEQIVVAALADRQTHNALINMEQRLAAMQKQLTVDNAAQWQALEQLVLAVLGSSNRAALAGVRSNTAPSSDCAARGTAV